MVTKKTQVEDENPFLNPAREIQQNTFEREVETSFLPYAVSTIIDRAIPSAIDGALPVQRRILWSMFEEGYTPDRAHVKSAKIVGAVIGNYHPHGDAACYGSMVRLGQGFALRVPLVEPHGAFGDYPGDEAAAPRYTEARLSQEAMLAVEELREDVVDFEDNYDKLRKQPVVLPVKFPNLLINGSSGVAVGFASNMPTHNPTEIIDATRWLLTHPNADLDKLMTFVPGPDFPSGGQIIGKDAIREAYETGRGVIRIRATATIESLGRGKHNIVFTELPYNVPAEKIIEKIQLAMGRNQLQGIADANDHTDHRHGIRLVVETKAGINPEVLLNELYMRTPLEDSFGINNTVIVDKTPRTLGLKELLQIFINHRVEVVTRRSKFRKEKREHRLEQVNAQLTVLADIDTVIKIVRTSDNETIAQAGLIKRFKVSDEQATYILNIPLRRLTRLNQLELEKEKATLVAELAELNKILGDDAVLRKLIGTELDQARKVLDRPRLSVLVDGNLAEHIAESKAASSNAAAALEVADEPVQVVIYADGSIARIAGLVAPKAHRSAGKQYPVIASLASTTRSKVIFVTNAGRGLRTENLHLAEKPAKALSVLALEKGERVIAVAPATGELGLGIFFATRNGDVKITNPDYPKLSDEFDLISLKPGDEIITARWVNQLEGGQIAFVASDASLLVFDAAKVRPQGRTGGGVAGIGLGTGQQVLTAAFVPADEVNTAMVYTFTGMSHKLTPLSAHPVKGRATGGSRAHTFRKGEDSLTFAHIGVNPLVVGGDFKPLHLPTVNPKRDASGGNTIETPALAGI